MSSNNKYSTITNNSTSPTNPCRGYEGSVKLNPYYITGFVDGEGSFIVTINPHTGYRTGYRVKATFSIGLHKRDLALLQWIQQFLGVGSIANLSLNGIIYRVSDLKELNVIISHFDKYPLLTKKQADFLLFKQVISLMEQGEHLSTEGLNKILSLKASMNLGLSDQLDRAFPGIVPVMRPVLNHPSLIKDFNWLAGFTEAEGCFFVSVRESLNSKLNEAVSLRFVLTQHLRDEEFMRSLIAILGCGRYIPRSNKDYGEFVVEKFSDINQKILPLFEQYQLKGIKRLDYEAFKKVAILMENRDHLTLNGLNEIKLIKSNMNTKRIL